MPRHGLKIAARTPLQALAVGGANLPRRRLGVESGASRRRKREVGVAIDEPGHDYAPGCIDFHGLARLGEIFHPARGAYFHQLAIANQQRSVLNQAKLAERGPATGTTGPSQGEQLAGAPD